MDPKRFKETYERLQALDERLTYKVRPRSSRGLHPATPTQLDERLNDLADFTLELKEVLDELFQSIAARSQADG